jgi:uncharacterized Ntn-hydrolase superfamily protein
MVESFHDSRECNLDERLMRALEVGRNAGGQAMPDSTAVTERSASLRVLGSGDEKGMHILDLRVDMNGSAVHELRRLFGFTAPTPTNEISIPATHRRRWLSKLKH